MPHPSQTETNSGSGRNQQQGKPPAAPDQSSPKADPTSDANSGEAMTQPKHQPDEYGKSPPTNGGYHPSTVKNR